MSAAGQALMQSMMATHSGLLLQLSSSSEQLPDCAQLPQVLQSPVLSQGLPPPEDELAMLVEPPVVELLVVAPLVVEPPVVAPLPEVTPLPVVAPEAEAPPPPVV